MFVEKVERIKKRAWKNLFMDKLQSELTEALKIKNIRIKSFFLYQAAIHEIRCGEVVDMINRKENEWALVMIQEYNNCFVNVHNE